MSYLRTIFEQELTEFSGGFINGSVKNRIPNTTNICFPGIRAGSIITSAPFIAMAMGSACTSAIPKPSHVLLAMGLSENLCASSIRFSLGRFTTKTQIEDAVVILKEAIINSKTN
ncbi:MAG: hypothetical protein IPP71_11715 [Bacteroidetes bacterium]|nr:hypothetical protein [Bacteroidota bacterium]